MAALETPWPDSKNSAAGAGWNATTSAASTTVPASCRWGTTRRTGKASRSSLFNNWNDYNPCHQHFKQRVDEVKRGVLQAGGFPLELPTVSLGENLIKPSALLYRNMLAMEVEEMIRVGENIAGAECFDDDVIRPLANPVYAEGSLAVLRGNLAPDGCVIKPSAMSARFLRHSGPALVFDDYPSLKKMLDDEQADVTEDHVIVLRNAGPKGGPGMPEWGMVPVPQKLIRQGVRDMLRISDARMSGTSYGACVLHVAPEAFVGGNLALVRTGDRISVDIPARSIHLEVSDEELARRRAAWVPPAPRFTRGYGWMFTQHILQADQGCDMDFLQSQFGESAGEPDIFEPARASCAEPTRQTVALVLRTSSLRPSGNSRSLVGGRRDRLWHCHKRLFVPHTPPQQGCVREKRYGKGLGSVERFLVRCLCRADG